MEFIHAQCRLELTEDDLICEVVLECEPAGPGFVVADVGQVILRNPHGPAEQGLLDRRGTCDLGSDAGMHLFIDTRDTHQEGRSDLIEVLKQLFRALGESHLVAKENGV